jgi:hypothetical protein
MKHVFLGLLTAFFDYVMFQRLETAIKECYLAHVKGFFMKKLLQIILNQIHVF